MKTEIKVISLIALLLCSPMLNAKDKISTVTEIEETTALMDKTARHCHRVIDIYGGYTAAINLYWSMIQIDYTSGKAVFGSCIEFRRAALRFALRLKDVEKEDRPKGSGYPNATKLLKYLKSIDELKNFLFNDFNH